MLTSTEHRRRARARFFRRSHVTLLVTAAAMIAGCRDYARNNPFDPGFSGTLTITGDTLIQSTGRIHTYQLSLTGEQRTLPVYWSSSNAAILAPRGGGGFEARGDGDEKVYAQVGLQTVEFAVHIVLVPAGVSARPCTASSLDALGDSVKICSVPVDSNGTEIRDLIGTGAMSVTDTSVIALHGEWAVARGNGSAVITTSYLGFTDTTTLTVAQRASRLTLSLDAPLSSGVYVIGDSGASAQLHAAGFDANGYPLGQGSAITFTVANPAFYTIDADTVLHAIRYGATTVTATSGALASSIQVRTTGGQAPSWSGVVAMAAPSIVTPLVLVEGALYDPNADVTSAYARVKNGTAVVGFGYGLPPAGDTLQEYVVAAVYNPAYSYTMRAVDASGSVAAQTVTPTRSSLATAPRITQSDLSLYKPDTTEFVISANDPQNDIREAIVVAERNGSDTWDVLSRTPLPAAGVSGLVIKNYWTYDRWDKVRVMIRDAAGNVSSAVANQNP